MTLPKSSAKTKENMILRNRHDLDLKIPLSFIMKTDKDGNDHSQVYIRMRLTKGQTFPILLSIEEI